MANWRYLVFGFFFLIMTSGSFVYAQNQRAVLVKGNSWITENNLFSVGVSTVLFGEYNVETQAAGSPAVLGIFSVRVSRDNQLLTGDSWQRRPGSGSFLQRLEGSNLYIGFQFAGGASLGSWTIVFQFPDPEKFDDPAINRLIDAWTGRFRYFLSLVKVPSDMSLPAVFNF